MPPRTSLRPFLATSVALTATLAAASLLGAPGPATGSAPRLSPSAAPAPAGSGKGAFPSPSAAPSAPAPTPSAEVPSPAPAPAASASSSPEPKTEPRTRYSVSHTVAGGVSLGSYEAGYLYYLSEFLKQNRDRADVQVGTGTSAGSVNALLALIDSCMPPELDPTASIFYKTWVPLGIEELFVSEDTTALGALSRHPFGAAFKEATKPLVSGVPTSCDFLFGAAVTRVRPREVPLKSPLVTIPRAQEHFTIRVRGQGVGKPALVDNYVDTNWDFPQAMLLMDGSVETRLASLRDLIFASTAFPLAFAPQPILHCLSRDEVGRPVDRCTGQNAGLDLFIDGAVFDNEPLRLAVQLAMSGLKPNARGQLDVSEIDRGQRDLPQDTVFLYLDTDTTSFRNADMADERPPEDAIGFLTELSAQMAGSARAAETFSLLQQLPSVRDHISPAVRYFPIVSDQLGAFMGFFEEEFRRYDFYLGMRDARHALAQSSWTPRRSILNGAVYPEELPQTARSDGWDAFRCVQHYLAEPGSTASAIPEKCNAPQFQGIRTLAQVSLTRLYQVCRDMPKPGRGGLHCQAASRGEAPPMFVGEKQLPDWRMAADEGELSYTLRLLESYNFRYHDLEVPSGKATDARRAIRNRLRPILARFVDVQPSNKFLLKSAIRSGINSLSYQPPAHIGHVVLGGTWELGYSTNVVTPWEWFRFSGAVGIEGVETLITSTPNRLAALPMAGIELEPLNEDYSGFQFRIGARGGYTFANANMLGSELCSTEQPGTTSNCNVWFIRDYLAITYQELARFQLNIDIAPKQGGLKQTLWRFQPTIGAQLASF